MEDGSNEQGGINGACWIRTLPLSAMRDPLGSKELLLVCIQPHNTTLWAFAEPSGWRRACALVGAHRCSRLVQPPGFGAVHGLFVLAIVLPLLKLVLELNQHNFQSGGWLFLTWELFFIGELKWISSTLPHRFRLERQEQFAASEKAENRMVNPGRRINWQNWVPCFCSQAAWSWRPEDF
jgi:hypothetical protein